MKKKIALSLSIITILICGGSIVENTKYLDIASNKTDWYVMDAKNKISERSDIDSCEKKVLQDRLDNNRQNQKNLSNIAFRTQIIALVVITIQLILLVVVFFMPNKVSVLKKNLN